MESRVGKIVSLSVTTLLLLLTILFNYLSTSAAGRNSGIFENTINSSRPWNQRGNIVDSGLTPPGFAFIVWGVIYAYQGAMLCSYWIHVFRRTDDGTSLCCLPGLMPTAALWAHSVSSVGNIAWTLLADRVDSTKVMLVPQTLAIFSMAVALCVNVGLSERGLRQLERHLGGCCCCLPGVVSGLCLNANGFYAGWVIVASFLNLDIAVINLSGWSVAQSGLLALSHVAAVCCAWVLLDLLVLRPRTLLAPYLTAVWALATSVGKNFAAGSAASVLSIELIVLLVLALALKVALLIAGRNATRDCRRVRPMGNDVVEDASADGKDGGEGDGGEKGGEKGGEGISV